ncbi:hypothetical protein PND53_09340 [Faecalitalea cylindroides]|uniref:glycosyl hydrolase-related protein n=1 Tax=Faecalitalea cylindroides TaxID=39483 RepID=UPI00189AA9A0|nr:glycosyl hydrolase-related protein [Faecalitalea cylindroides]MDB7947692.1 hypothetical protein [Faecalitalea cylindroides]MDB7949569.1 hypothetical protein [Faecalitalea cylindroides]MDB7951424.1 hypothetical protein [Faecalitalea cylindroides]
MHWSHLSKEQWEILFYSSLNNDYLSKTAKLVGISIVSAFYNRHKLMYVLNELINKKQLSKKIALDETYLTYQAKGFVNQNRRGISKDKIGIACAIDEDGNYVVHTADRGRPTSSTLIDIFKNTIRPESIVISDSQRSYHQIVGIANLKYRPGRRSGSTDATPDSQMLGKFTCDYAFLSIDKNVNYKILAENYVNPIYGVAMPEFSSDGNLPDCLDLISSEDEVFISALKLAEDHKGYILRLLNPDYQPLKNAEVQINRYYVDSIEQTDLAERSIDSDKIHVIKLNNPDGSAKAVMSGKVVIDSMNQNELLTLRLK